MSETGPHRENLSDISVEDILAAAPPSAAELAETTSFSELHDMLSALNYQEKLLKDSWGTDNPSLIRLRQLKENIHDAIRIASDKGIE